MPDHPSLEEAHLQYRCLILCGETRDDWTFASAYHSSVKVKRCPEIRLETQLLSNYTCAAVCLGLTVVSFITSILYSSYSGTSCIPSCLIIPPPPRSSPFVFLRGKSRTNVWPSVWSPRAEHFISLLSGFHDNEEKCIWSCRVFDDSDLLYTVPESM